MAAVAFGLFKDDKSGGMQAFSVLTVLGILVYIYLLAKYGVRKKFLQLYLINLSTGDAVQALETGRRYYSIRRKGLTGADGSGLTIYDEQAIHNDITSFAHGGTRSIDYDSAETAFTPTKMLMAAGLVALSVGVVYLISPKYNTGPSTEVVAANVDYKVESESQQIQSQEVITATSIQENEEQVDISVQQKAVALDSVQQSTEVESSVAKEASSSAEQNLDVIGTWIGTLGQKPFVLHIDEAVGGKLTGWNKTGNNKRPVTGDLREFAERDSNVKYELTINEPGSDKWDGAFTLTLTAPMANAAPTLLMGEWKSFNGKLTKQVEAQKVVE